MKTLSHTPTGPRDYAVLNLAWVGLVTALLRATRDGDKQAPGPREGRIVASVLTTAAINDLLQAGFSFAAAKADATKSGAEVAASRARGVEPVADDSEPAAAAVRS